jgi:hypothetical protein
VKTKQQRQLDSKSVCGRPLSSYDIFYILEPELLIQSKSKEGTATSYHRDHDAEVTSASVGPTKEEKLERSTSDMYREFIDLELPPFPSRYRSIEGNLQVDWYMYDKNKSELHRGSADGAFRVHRPRRKCSEGRGVDLYLDSQS